MTLIQIPRDVLDSEEDAEFNTETMKLRMFNESGYNWTECALPALLAFIGQHVDLRQLIEVHLPPSDRVQYKQDVVDLLADLDGRLARGEFLGLVAAIMVGPSRYELKWAGWNDPVTLAGALDLAKYALMGDSLDAPPVDGSVSHSGPSANVSPLRPKDIDARARDIGAMLGALTVRTVRGEIVGMVAALYVADNQYSVHWKGWNDPVMAMGAMELAKHGMLRSMIAKG
jgi:hypothetical protein